MFKFFLKEGSLLSAFIVLGGLLLLSVWMTSSVQKVIQEDFNQTQITLVSKNSEAVEPLRHFLENNETVVRFEVQTGEQNKERILKTYSELEDVLKPLRADFFPLSFLVTVVRKEEFMESLGLVMSSIDRYVAHEAPHGLAGFLNMVTFIFIGLWVLTLTLVLYFNLERLTAQEEPKWSLMKMLGEKPWKLFVPLWRGQMVRVIVASLFAILLAYFSSQKIVSFFAWKWTNWEISTWVGFFVVAVILTTLLSYTMFQMRYKKVLLG